MELEWVRPGVLRVTSHAYEFAALVAAARYVTESAPAEIPEEALEQMRGVLADYDTRLREATARSEEEP
ncbi:hypothetical protein BLA24_21865 [Streptomyces cinnamoneus]|uniref:Uncharacterized protein n=1 Tax=Streptomyces cinnamoneus TaxID=53446 RepID=A0A2G1XGF1_STRCJ|nr:hypothetical protein [Streptomyces cinnamoneus]PHQ50219.1 hypothetical protein BLA24_21865 [Streptomyces cinnamoneus]PPT12997.1 hypothetical protein CYQ11_08920 [Streptomyces cinnamoneus]